MTPFPVSPPRTATITLSRQEEHIVRNGFDTSNFDMALVARILEKLHKSLEVSDVLLRPREEVRAEVEARRAARTAPLPPEGLLDF